MLTLRPGEMGGSETYARGLLEALRRDGTLPYACFVPPVAPDAGYGLPTVVVPEYGPAGGKLGKGVAVARAVLFPGPLRRRLGKLAAIHYLFTIPVPRTGVPSALTLQDLLHHEAPGLFPRSERLFRRLAYDRAARGADVVIVPSEFVRRRVAERLGIPEDRQRVIHYGVDHKRFRPGDEAREPFLLYPARPWPHKNHARLFEAFARLRGERPELELVLTGGGHEALWLPAGVRSLGLVGADELAALYRRAGALVFPSLHEGFGYPPLEAMASGCPVACSTATSLPEICGDAVVPFDPGSPDEIAGAALQALDGSPELVRRGLEHAATFTWARAAAAHEEVYRELSASAAAT